LPSCQREDTKVQSGTHVGLGGRCIGGGDNRGPKIGPSVGHPPPRPPATLQTGRPGSAQRTVGDNPARRKHPTRGSKRSSIGRLQPVRTWDIGGPRGARGARPSPSTAGPNKPPATRCSRGPEVEVPIASVEANSWCSAPRDASAPPGRSSNPGGTKRQNLRHRMRELHTRGGPHIPF